MGNIARFDVVGIAHEYDIHTFVETGTGKGESLSFALGCFDDLLSCEVHIVLATRAMTRFDDEAKIRVFKQDSLSFLTDVCRILPRRQPVMFWLDAHFPGADYGLARFDAEPDAYLRLPLQYELDVIRRKRGNRDVILIDDARIWLDGPFQHGNLPTELRPLCPKERNIDFIHELFSGTHTIDVLYDHEGYIQVMPREVFGGAG